VRWGCLLISNPYLTQNPSPHITIPSPSLAFPHVYTMFYSPDILKHKEGFSVIWSVTPVLFPDPHSLCLFHIPLPHYLLACIFCLCRNSSLLALMSDGRLAATLGAKSSLKRLQKRDILSVDVPEACTFLSNPPDQPLALRLSSNLMYGVTRIFSQQYTFFYSNLHHFPLLYFPFFKMVSIFPGDVSDLRFYGCVSEERFRARFWNGEVTVDDVSLLQTRIRRDISINAIAAIILDDFPMKHTPRKYPPLDNPPFPFHYLSSPHSFIHAPI
jgi:hypothetical protein